MTDRHRYERGERTFGFAVVGLASRLDLRRRRRLISVASLLALATSVVVLWPVLMEIVG